MQPNKLGRWEYKGKNYVKNIRKNSCRIWNRIRIRHQLKSRIRIGIRKNHSGSTTLLLPVPSLYVHFDFAILQEWGPEAVPVDQSWCNGCGQLFTGAADKKAYKCPACRQVRQLTSVTGCSLPPPPLPQGAAMAVSLHMNQCSGFGSGIRCFFDLGIRDGKKSKARIRYEYPGSYFWELTQLTISFWVKNTWILLCGSGSGILSTLNPGYGMEKSDPGSGINIPDPTVIWRSNNTRFLSTGIGDWLRRY
jgi:hypothetical protein